MRTLTAPESQPPEARPSEAGHWYNQHGEPRYEVPRADGKGTRPATLRDARKAAERDEVWVPSVTTILSLIKAGALMDWWGRHVAETAVSLPGADVTQILEKAGEKSAEARTRGIEIHTWVESYFKNDKALPKEGLAICDRVADVLTENFGVQDWVAEQSFSHPDGFGGKVDLYFSPRNLRNPVNRMSLHGAVVDVKTADFPSGTKPGRYAYPDRAIQLAMYAYGLGMPMARIANVIVSTQDHDPPLVLYHEWEGENNRWLMAGLSLLELWKNLKGYDGSW